MWQFTVEAYLAKGRSVMIREHKDGGVEGLMDFVQERFIENQPSH